jgi:DNA-binding transcriptional LysR family regulator
MKPEQLPALQVFCRVAHHGSFTRAAAELGVSSSALSQTVRTLETQLCVRLLNRTTRAVSVTEAGSRLLAELLPGLERIGRAVQQLDEDRGTPSGLLKVNASRIAAGHLLIPRVAEFARRYPAVKLELHLDDALIDVVAGGFDAGMRLGESLVQDMVAVPISQPQRAAVVATPDYVKRRGKPKTPEDLRDHDCVEFRLATGALYRWEFERDGREFEISVAGPLTVNDGYSALLAARSGLGYSYLFEESIADDLRSGALLRVLDDWCPPFPGFFLYYPSRAQLPMKLRVFVDFMREGLE